MSLESYMFYVSKRAPVVETAAFDEPKKNLVLNYNKKDE